MLDQVEIFHGLSDEELKALEGSSTTRAFPKNTVVIHENDPADSLFVIESGKVKVYCSDKNGKEFIMELFNLRRKHQHHEGLLHGYPDVADIVKAPGWLRFRLPGDLAS